MLREDGGTQMRALVKVCREARSSSSPLSHQAAAEDARRRGREGHWNTQAKGFSSSPRPPGEAPGPEGCHSGMRRGCLPGLIGYRARRAIKGLLFLCSPGTSLCALLMLLHCTIRPVWFGQTALLCVSLSTAKDSSIGRIALTHVHFPSTISPPALPLIGSAPPVS